MNFEEEKKLIQDEAAKINKEINEVVNNKLLHYAEKIENEKNDEEFTDEEVLKYSKEAKKILDNVVNGFIKNKSIIRVRTPSAYYRLSTNKKRLIPVVGVSVVTKDTLQFKG